jgi:hypothetical protein
MHRMLFGLALISLMACSSAFAGDTPNSGSGGSQDVQKPLPPSQIHRSKTIKQVSGRQSDGRSGPRSLPLSSAEAYASEHSAGLPISSAPKSPPPSTRPWTGFYVGAGAGIGATQP